MCMDIFPGRWGREKNPAKCNDEWEETLSCVAMSYSFYSDLHSRHFYFE